MELKVVRMEIPEDANIILGQSHFIKTIEDIYEAMASSDQVSTSVSHSAKHQGNALYGLKETMKNLN